VSGKLVAVANMKGGVGKTTTVVMLAETLAADGHSVLVVDLDPQASVSLCITGDTHLAKAIGEGRTLDYYLGLRIVDRKRAVLTTFVQPFASTTTHLGNPLPLSLLPSAPALRIVEREIISALTRRRKTLDEIEGVLWEIFQDEFDGLREHFDYVLFDCAPGISPFTEVAIRSCDLVIVPTIPDFLSTYGLQAFCRMIWDNTGESALPRPKQLPHVLPTRVQKVVQQTQRLAQMKTEAGAPDAGFRLMRARIPQSAQLSAMVCSPYQTYSRKYADIVAHEAAILRQEVKEVVDGH